MKNLSLGRFWMSLIGNYRKIGLYISNIGKKKILIMIFLCINSQYDENESLRLFTNFYIKVAMFNLKTLDFFNQFPL